MAIAKQKAALTNMNMAKLNLDSCKIIAPFKGRLISRIAQEHEYLKAGQPVLSVIDDTKLLAVVHLPSGLKNSLKIGQEFEIKVDETGQTYKGKVHEISGEVDPGSKTFSIKLLVDNPQGVLSPGMSGSLQRAAIEQVVGKTAESAGLKK
jgi:RND family efflux transporter MFP subunit